MRRLVVDACRISRRAGNGVDALPLAICRVRSSSTGVLPSFCPTKTNFVKELGFVHIDRGLRRRCAFRDRVMPSQRGQPTSMTTTMAISCPTRSTVSDSEAEDLAGAGDLMDETLDAESWSDDPVRMYLTQMGEIPLLTRKQEIELAKRIEKTRQRFRSKLLECDYVIQYAYKILTRVHNGELPFDRTVQVSVTDRLEKDQILGRLPHNLRTLDVVAEAQSPRLPDRRQQVGNRASSAKQAWQRLGRGRRRAVRLVEELGLRTQRIEPMIRHAGGVQPPGRRTERQDRRRTRRPRGRPPNASAGSRSTATC